MPMPDVMTAALQRAAAEEAEVQWGEPISAEDLALPLESASRTTEGRIWLQPACADDCERCWADHDFGPCEDCGLPCVAYVRAEAAERQIAECMLRMEGSERERDIAYTLMEESDKQLAEAQSERNELAAQIEEWGAEKEAACMRAELAERQLAEARKPEDYWRQVAEATELTKRDMEQSIAILIEYRARLEQELAEALGQLGAEHAAHLATGKWLADTEHLLRTILDAEQHFRNALPEEWDGDPIHDACEAARAALPDEPLWTTPPQP